MAMNSWKRAQSQFTTPGLVEWLGILPLWPFGPLAGQKSQGAKSALNGAVGDSHPWIDPNARAPNRAKRRSKMDSFRQV